MQPTLCLCTAFDVVARALFLSLVVALIMGIVAVAVPRRPQLQYNSHCSNENGEECVEMSLLAAKDNKSAVSSRLQPSGTGGGRKADVCDSDAECLQHVFYQILFRYSLVIKDRALLQQVMERMKGTIELGNSTGTGT